MLSKKLPIVKTKNIGLNEIDSNKDSTNENKQSSNTEFNPNNRQFLSFREDNLEIKFCIGVFWNEEFKQYYVQIFLKKVISNNHKLLLTDSELFIKCSFSGFGVYYCAISKSRLTNFFIHRKFSSKNDDFVDATFEIIPFLPFKLECNYQLVPLLAVAHSPAIPPLKFYDSEWPFVSYIRQMLSFSDGTIPHPPLNVDQKSNPIIFDFANISHSDIKNNNQIFGMTKSVCEELGVKYQAIYGIPQNVYTNKQKVKLNSDTDFLIYTLPPEFQSEVPTIVSVDFADQNPFYLCSLIRKETKDDYYFLTIYSPSLNKFYSVTDNNISLFNSKPRCYNDEYIISALYIRLNILNLFRFFSLTPTFTPRFNLVTIYEIDRIFYLTDFEREIEINDLMRSVPHKNGVERADDLDEEPEIALFHYDPDNFTFPSIPLACASSQSILKIPIDPKIKKFQLIWFCINSTTYIPVIADLTDSNCIEVPKEIEKSHFIYDLFHINSNSLTTPYKADESLPTGPMLFFKCRNVKKFMKAVSFSFGKIIATQSLIQFTKPPFYTRMDRYSLPRVLNEVKKERKIDNCNCYIRTNYIHKNKTIWMKLPNNDADINTFFSEKFTKFEKEDFIQIFIELP